MTEDELAGDLGHFWCSRTCDSAYVEKKIIKVFYCQKIKIKEQYKQYSQ